MFDKRLLALLGEDKKYVVAIVICNMLSTVSNVALAFSLCLVVDRMLTGASAMAAYTLPMLAATAAALLRFGLGIASGRFAARLGSNAKEMLRRRIYEKVAALGVRETDELSLAALTQVGIEGVEQLDLYYSTYIPQFFYSVMSPFLLFALLMFVSVPSAVILILCVPLIPASIIAVSRYAKKIFARYWGQYTKMGDAFLDNISGMKELKIFAADGMYHDKMNAEAEEFRKITMKVLTMQLASTTIMDLVAYGGAGLGIGIAILTRSRLHPVFSMEPAALLLFIVLIAVDFFLPLRALGSAFHVSMNGATAGKKILTLLDTPEPVWGDKEVDACDLTMEEVSFSYTKDREILKDISLEAHRGKLVAIVGLSGSGKSTIMSLLSGIRPVEKGRILVGSHELRELSREDYYRHMGMVSYNTYLFHESIRSNFRLAKPDITDEEIRSRLAAVDLADFPEANGGLDRILKEGSVDISGGQRQRLALAVHLAADKDIYLFDEVTSNIDAESEEIILRNIYELSRSKTVLMVSHRLKNFVRADRIYVLADGRVAECGTHQTLLEQGGLYSAMYHRQLELEEGYRR